MDLKQHRDLISEAQTSREKLVLEKLAYARDGLEPVMSKATVDLHYGVLSKGYVDRYNNREGDDAFNYGGAILHNMYWATLQPPSTANKPHGASEELINKKFGSYEKFKKEFISKAKALQGSGWCYMDVKGNISTLPNQGFKKSIRMALPIDMWEHSYLLDTNKDRYLEGIWKIINWSIVNDRLQGE
jgi:Fe-Mn family superoxide dismutase